VLLQRAEVERLTVVLMNLSVAKASLTYLDHRDWLSDPRICLLSAASEMELLVPFACAPACLYLADDGSARLRDLLQLELATPFIRGVHRHHKAKYLTRIAENESFIGQDADVAELFGSCAGGNIVVAGAGPTLSDHYDWLARKRQHFVLIAVDVAVKSLLAAGISPDVVVAIDVSPKLYEIALGNLDIERLKPTALVYFPLVDKKLLSSWPGRRFVAYSRDDVYAQIALEYPRGKLFSSGSVIHPAVDLAVKSGATRVVLVGADFSFPRGKSHVEGSGTSVKTIETNDWVLNGKGLRVPTLPSYRGYLLDLESYIARHPEIEFVNCSLEGARIKGAAYFKGGGQWSHLI